jgi:hypothetical protein
MAAHEKRMSSFDDLDEHFGVGKKLRETLTARFRCPMEQLRFSMRWWPRRSAPTSAFARAHRDEKAAGEVGGSYTSRIEAWFILGPNRIVEEKHDALLAHAVEVMSPVPHDAAMWLMDAFEFFQLGGVLRELPSTLATDLALVWHAPKFVDGRLTFFAFGAMRGFRRVSIDLETARVDETPLA